MKAPFFKTKKLYLFLIFLSVLLYSFCLFDAGSTVYIAYPRIKEDKTFYIFFNKTKIGNLHYGERMEYNFLSEGILKIVIQEEQNYIEPKTLSRNTRTVAVQKGKNLYFEINGKGEFEYLFYEEKGKKLYTTGSYAGSPHVYKEETANHLLLQ